MTLSDPGTGTPAHPATHTLLHDPDGQLEAAQPLPLDRAPYESLVKAVLAWTGQATLQARDYEQIALQLTSHARALATRVEHLAGPRPKNSGPRALADIVLRETDRRLSVPIEATARCAQNRARLVRALYARLDRLESTNP